MTDQRCSDEIFSSQEMSKAPAIKVTVEGRTGSKSSDDESFVILENEDIPDVTKEEDSKSVIIERSRDITKHSRPRDIPSSPKPARSRSPAMLASVSKSVQLDVVELLKQVLQWTPLYKPGLNRALIQAAKVGSGGCVKVLVSAGADIDTEDENGDTPFVHAFRERHTSVMEILRDLGCNTEIAKMSLALATMDKTFVKFCHQMDIPVENEDWNVSDVEEVTFLLEELKLDPFQGVYGHHGYEDSPFMYLTQEGKPEVLEATVMKHPFPERYTEEDRLEKINFALFKAIRHHRFDNAKLLLGTLGAQLNFADAQGRTAFLFSCGHDETIARYMMDFDVDLEAADCEGLNALHWAACSGYEMLCKDLLAKGLDPQKCAKLGATPLMVACSNGHCDIARLLVAAGADTNMHTPEGWTALHVAVRACAPNVVKFLLAHDALPDVQSSKLTHNSDVVPASTPLLIAISLNSIKMIRHLMDVNCDLDLPGLVFTNPSHSSSESEEDYKYRKQRCTPIQYAIISRAWDIAELIIKAGCNVASVRLWLEFKRAPVHIPDETSKKLRHLIHQSTTTAPKLRHIVRRRIRQLLGRCLSSKLDTLNLQPSVKKYILFHDLFLAQAGSFEV